MWDNNQLDTGTIDTESDSHDKFCLQSQSMYLH